jgi:hypothetical protein
MTLLVCYHDRIIVYLYFFCKERGRMDPGQSYTSNTINAGGGEDETPELEGNGMELQDFNQRGSLERLFYEEDSNKVNVEGSSYECDSRRMEMGCDRARSGATFYQCRAAREAKASETIFDLVEGRKVTENFVRIGSLDSAGDDMVQRTFHSARATKYHKVASVEVNQGITCSYDPATFMCMMCDREHKVTEDKMDGRPNVLCFSDQNFVSGLAGDVKNCIGILRMESCMLDELGDMVFETLEGVNLRPGTVLLIGSASHLHRVGVSLYARDWNSCVAKIEQKWGGIQICPLVPILSESCSQAVVREITEFAAWLIETYKGSPKSLTEVWAYLVRYFSTEATGSDATASRITYTIPLPATLAPNAPLERTEVYKQRLASAFVQWNGQNGDRRAAPCSYQHTEPRPDDRFRPGDATLNGKRKV